MITTQGQRSPLRDRLTQGACPCHQKTTVVISDIDKLSPYSGGYYLFWYIMKWMSMGYLWDACGTFEVTVLDFSGSFAWHFRNEAAGERLCASWQKILCLLLKDLAAAGVNPQKRRDTIVGTYFMYVRNTFGDRHPLTGRASPRMRYLPPPLWEGQTITYMDLLYSLEFKIAFDFWPLTFDSLGRGKMDGDIIFNR